METAALQVEPNVELQNSVNAIFKYLKLGVKLYETVTIIRFNKPCFYVIPDINNNAKITNKVKIYSKKLWYTVNCGKCFYGNVEN